MIKWFVKALWWLWVAMQLVNQHQLSLGQKWKIMVQSVHLCSQLWKENMSWVISREVQMERTDVQLTMESVFLLTAQWAYKSNVSNFFCILVILISKLQWCCIGNTSVYDVSYTDVWPKLSHIVPTHNLYIYNHSFKNAVWTYFHSLFL